METTRNAILERLLKDYKDLNKDDISHLEGTFSFDTLSANSKEFEKAYAEISLVGDIAFLQSSWGEYLTAKCEEYGVMRRQATKAVVILTITGSERAYIPKGSLFSTADGKNFYTIADSVIGSTKTVDVKAEASNVGTEYNVEANTINQIPMSIYGVAAVTNKAAAYDGFNLETDDELKKRTLFKLRMPATSGNVYHYYKWATSVEGVGGVNVQPLWNGNGTVKVVVIDVEKSVASEDLLGKVRKVIAENAPIGATVTVVSAQVLELKLKLKVTDGAGNAEAIKKVLNDYLKDSALTNKAVSYAQLGRIILDNVNVTGVKDYTDLTVNGGTGNIPITIEQLPRVSEVSLS